MLQPLLIVSLACCLMSHVTIAEVEFVASPYSQCPMESVTLNFSTTRINEIGRGFLGSAAITCLDLNKNVITKVVKNAFDSLPNLKQLYLSHNYIVDLNDLLSSSMPKLELLDLTDSQHGLTRPQVINGSFPALRSLSLQYTAIKTINITRIHPFPKLERFDLSRNALDSEKFIDIMPKTIQYLNVSRNELWKFSAQSLTNLSVLDLSGNKFFGVAYQNVAFANVTLIGLKGLRELTLSNNRISTIKKDAFKDTIGLEVLNLNQNSLASIPPEAFSPLKSLKVLLLTSNLFNETLTSQKPLSLISLHLGKNRITSVADNAFSWAPNLKLLRLNDNQLSTIGPKAFSSLKNLEVLDLSSNFLRTLPSEWCSNLNNLQYLDLKSNYFQLLESTSMNNRIPLRYLFFEWNELVFLKQNSFSSFPQNVTINFDTTRANITVPDIIYQ